MFTGLIRHTGTLKARYARGITIAAPGLGGQLAPGDSVAVNGACLTVEELTAHGFRADLLAETASATTLGKLASGSRLNLELALAAGDRLGGHFVQGHVDGTARVAEVKGLPGGDWRLACELPGWLEPYALPKGSIAIDGISLTIQQVESGRFSVHLIPTTWRDTALNALKADALVNIEADMLVKAVVQTIRKHQESVEYLSTADIRRWGYGS